LLDIIIPRKITSNQSNEQTTPVPSSYCESSISRYSLPEPKRHLSKKSETKEKIASRQSVSVERDRCAPVQEAKEMGLSAGGKMKQKIVQDRYGLDHRDTTCFGRCYVHIVNSAMFEQITGKKPPSTPVSAKTYSSYGYPWYDMYEENISGVKGSSILDNVKSVKEIDQEKFMVPQQNDSTVPINFHQVKTIHNKNAVRDGDW
jgi:hypothetical protein